MINLLPAETKEDIFYGRKNTVVRRWIISFIFSLLGLGIIVGIGSLYLNREIRLSSTELEQSKQAMQEQKIEETQKRLKEISGDTTLLLQVLSKEVLFSKLLTQLGSAVPANTSLISFQVDKLQGGLTLMAEAKDIDSATQLQLNLQDPENKIFEKADIENIKCADDEPEEQSPSAPAAPKYPCKVQIRALFTKNNPFVYITPQELLGLGGKKL